MRQNIIIFFLLLNCSSLLAQDEQHRESLQNVDLKWLDGWLSAWELLSEEVLSLPRMKPPEMVFFDEQYVYSTSAISVPEGELLRGPELFSEQPGWRMAPHNGKITLPDGHQIPAQIMSFAAPLESGAGESFFVMAAPSIWEKSGIQSKELGLDKLLTAIFLHEFSHARQMDGFGALVSMFEKQYEFKTELNDNVVQDYFSQDSLYVQAFKEEVNKFYEAAFTGDEETKKGLAQEAMSMLRKRQSTYFVEDKKMLKELDDLFLSMEGSGQFAGLAWLMHPKGGNLPFALAVDGIRRDGSQWSQDEGLAMFLVLYQMSSMSWAKELYSEKPTYISDLLEHIVLKEDTDSR